MQKEKENDWSCSCPDFVKRKKPCKHCLFVIARVLGLSVSGSEDKERRNRALQQRILLISHRKENDTKVIFEILGTTSSYNVIYDGSMLGNADNVLLMVQLVSSFMVQPESKEAKEIDQHKKDQEDEANGYVLGDNIHKRKRVPLKVEQRPFLGEDCAICYEPMTDSCVVVYCEKTCGKSVHSMCFERYSEHTRKCICAYCRAPMNQKPTKPAKKKRRFIF
jgi:hypothetical protein